ncbi:MAG: 4-hydroxy-tetrahydrodipicolinate reductase [Actinomycetota bacterium]
MIRVAVLGAGGKMGRLVCRTVTGADDLGLVAAINPSFEGRPLGPIAGIDTDLSIARSLDALLDAEAEVAVDFTEPDAVMDNVRYAVDHGIHTVVGTTGMTPERLQEIEGCLAAQAGDVGVVVAPNFSIGAVVGQRLAEEAARFFPAAEVIELHHDQKLDAPSGTAAATARRIAAARKESWSGPVGGEEFRGGDVDGVRVHSVRLPGLVAHQEVVFGGQGQTLTIRHDAPDRTSYMPGVLMAIRQVVSRPGLTVGLEPLLGL